MEYLNIFGIACCLLLFHFYPAGYRMIAATDPLVHYVDVANPFLKQDGTVMDDIFVADDLHLNTMGNLIWGASIRAALMPLEARHETALKD